MMIGKLLVLTMIVLSVAPLQAKEECTRTYLVGVAEDQLKSDKNKKVVVGLATEFLSEIKKRVNCQYTDVPLSPDKAVTEFQNYRLDLYAFAFSSEQFRKVADEVDIYSTSRILLVDKKLYQPNLKVRDYLKNPKMKFAAVSSSLYWFSSEEDKLLSNENRVLYAPQADGVIDLLVKGKVQATFTSPAFLNRQIATHDILKYVVAIPDPEFRLTVALLFGKKRVTAAERAQFAQAVKEMKDQEVTEKILLHYVPAEDLKKYYKY